VAFAFKISRFLATSARFYCNRRRRRIPQKGFLLSHCIAILEFQIGEKIILRKNRTLLVSMILWPKQSNIDA
jgi:hypothetical protein